MEKIITEALNAASSLVEISRRYFPKSIRNSDRFQLENTCATINRAKEYAAAQSDPRAFIAERVGYIIGELAVTQHWTPSQVADAVRRELSNYNLDCDFNRGYTTKTYQVPEGWTLFEAYGTFYRWSEEAGLEYQPQLADGTMEPIDPEEGPNVPDLYASEAIHKCDAVIIAYLKAPDAPENTIIRQWLADPGAWDGSAALPVVCDECGIRFGSQCEHF